MLRAVLFALLIALPLVAPVTSAERDAKAATRSMRLGAGNYTIGVEAFWPRGIKCARAAVAVAETVATISLPCRTVPSFKPKSRGVLVSMTALVFSESETPFDSCEASARVKVAGPFSLACEANLPSAPPPPPPPQFQTVEISGTGDVLTEPVFLPVGAFRLRFSCSASASDPRSTSYSLDALGETNDPLFFAYGDCPVQSGEAGLDSRTAQRVVFEINVPLGSSWTLTIADAFPD